MRVVTVAPAAGRSWVTRGFALLRRQPIGMLALTFFYVFVLMVVTILPLVGAVAPLVLAPALFVGLMHAARAADQGQQPNPMMLFAGFRDGDGKAWRPLLVLGVANAAFTFVALAAGALADGGTMLRLATGQERVDDPAIADSSLAMGGLIFLLVYTPLQLALWYAPLFAAWHGASAGKAMFFSLVAVLRNRWAFVQYGLAWLAVALLASLLVQLVKMIAGDSPLMLSMLLSPLSLIVLAALYCSFWPSYRDVVQEGDAPPGGGTGSDAS